jgi:hypothetical protein
VPSPRATYSANFFGAVSTLYYVRHELHSILPFIFDYMFFVLSPSVSEDPSNVKVLRPLHVEDRFGKAAIPDREQITECFELHDRAWDQRRQTFNA